MPSISSGPPSNSQPQVAAFGELNVAQLTPQVQVKFPYNLNTDLVTALNNKSGSSVAVTDGICTVTASSTAKSLSQLRTLDVLRYGPGQGALFRGTCAFTTGVALSSQVCGPGDDDEGFFFGFNGTAFSILHRHHGQYEIRKLTITAGADAGGGDFVITLDGTAVTISVEANDTISEVVAATVAAASDFAAAGRGWQVHTDDNISVEFISCVAEAAAGTFSFSDTDSGVTAGTFQQSTTEVLGVAPTEVWTAQTLWNRDTFDGTSSSGVTLDPTKLNVYQVQYQFLGAGSIEFFIENPETGHFILVHVIEYANTVTTSSLRNPTLHLSLIAKTEASYSGGALVMKTGSLAGFIEGLEAVLGIRHAVSNAKSTTGTTPVNVLTIHSQIDFQGSNNKIEVYPDYLTIASETVKTVTFEIIRNPTQIDGTVVMTDIDSATSVMQKDVAGTTIVGGTELLILTLGTTESKVVDLKPLNLKLRPGDRWVFTATVASGSDAPVTVGITWLERI